MGQVSQVRGCRNPADPVVGTGKTGQRYLRPEGARQDKNPMKCFEVGSQMTKSGFRNEWKV